VVSLLNCTQLSWAKSEKSVMEFEEQCAVFHTPPRGTMHSDYTKQNGN
jgi:hypothetical protein